MKKKLRPLGKGKYNTYTTIILQLMREGNKLTPMSIAEHCFCYCLSQRIGELKRRGHEINAKKTKGENWCTYWQTKAQAAASKKLEEKII